VPHQVGASNASELELELEQASELELEEPPPAFV
jgi:hypothetical protein